MPPPLQFRKSSWRTYNETCTPATASFRASPERASGEGGMMMFTTITREALERKLDAAEPVILVEALPEKYYRHSHLPGAVNIPHDRSEERSVGKACRS